MLVVPPWRGAAPHAPGSVPRRARVTGRPQLRSQVGAVGKFGAFLAVGIGVVVANKTPDEAHAVVGIRDRMCHVRMPHQVDVVRRHEEGALCRRPKAHKFAIAFKCSAQEVLRPILGPSHLPEEPTLAFGASSEVD